MDLQILVGTVRTGERAGGESEGTRCEMVLSSSQHVDRLSWCRDMTSHSVICHEGAPSVYWEGVQQAGGVPKCRCLIEIRGFQKAFTCMPTRATPHAVRRGLMDKRTQHGPESGTHEA